MPTILSKIVSRDHQDLYFYDKINKKVIKLLAEILTEKQYISIIEYMVTLNPDTGRHKDIFIVKQDQMLGMSEINTPVGSYCCFVYLNNFFEVDNKYLFNPKNLTLEPYYAPDFNRLHQQP